MMFKTPTRYFIVAGSSSGYTPLNAFDGALLNAGVGNTNIVKVSSIIPPGAQRIEPIQLPLGALVPSAYASICSEIPGEIISAAVAVGCPKNPKVPGLIMEYSARGHKEDIEEIARNMAREAMTSRNLEIARIESVSAEFQVKTIGVALAAVILWDE
jgi:arginine decarboxylase